MRSITVNLGLSLLLVPFLYQSVYAVEVSELTVDFPLADVLDISQDTVPDTGGEGQPAAIPAAWKATWEEDWFAFRRKAVRTGLSEAKESLDRINRYRLESGIPNLYLPAAALLAEASVAREQSRHKDALDIIDYAGMLAPDDPAPHFLRAKTKWSQNRLGVLGSLDALLQGWIAFFKDFRSLFPWSLDLLLWILFGTLTAAVITILLVALQVFPRISHDLSHLLKLPQWFWHLAIPVMLGVLLLTGIPFVLWTVLLAVFMIVHLSSRQRVMIVLAVFLMVSLPLITHLLSLGNSFFSDASGLTLYTAERGGEGARALEELHNLRVRNQKDSRVLSTLAIVLRRGGRIREAESYQRRAMEISPESPLILNNLANVMLARGKIEQAIDYYRRALRYSDDPRIHYNLSQALRENLQLEEGEKEFLIAQQEDPELTSSIASGQAEGGKRITVDIFMSLADYLKDAIKINESGKVWREQLWSGVLPKVPFRFGWLIFPVFSLVLLAGWPLGKNATTAERCQQCNRLHCTKCSEGSQEALCSQCKHIFHIRTGVDPASRVKKMMHIMRFKKRRSLQTRIMTLILPGTGHVFLDAGWRSLVMIAITMLFWSKWILWHGLYRNTTMFTSQPEPLMKIIYFLLFGIYYLLVLRSAGTRLEEV